MDIGSLLNRAWQRFTSDIGMCIGVFLLGIILFAVSAITLYIVGIPIMAGMLKSFRSVARGGKADINDLFSEIGNIGYWIKLWGVMIVIGIVCAILARLTLLGLMADIAIEIVLGYLLYFVFPLMIDRRMDAIEAIKTSIDASKNNVGTLLGPILVAVLVGAAGSIVLGIGGLVTMPLSYIMVWMIYDQFYGLAAAPVSSMPTVQPGDPAVVPPPPSSESSL